MNKHIQIIVLSSMLIATLVQAERTTAGAAQHQIKTFTTEELNKKRTIIHDHRTTRSGSPVQTVGTQFTALAVTDADVLFRAQPNCNGFVGPTQYLLNSDQSIRSFNKFTGEPDGIIDIDSSTFLSVPTADARCAFDPWGQRWLVLGDLGDFTLPISESITGISLAWSDGPIITPQTKWSLRVFTNAEVAVPQTPPGKIDSPNLNTDQNAVYINMDVFINDPTLLGSGSYATALVIPQSSFIAGNPFTFTAFKALFNPLEFPVASGLGQSPTASNFDPNPQYGYLVCNVQVEFFGSGLTYDNFLMYRILNAGSNSPSLFPAPPTVLNPIPATPPISLAAPVYADCPFMPHKGNLYGQDISVGPGSLQATVNFDVGGIHVRNHQLYLISAGAVDNTGTGSATGDRAAILWYQYDLTGDPTGQGMGTETPSTVPVLIQSGVIFDPTITATPISYWNPSIMTNKNGDMVIIGNFAGIDNYVQAFYTGRKATDPLGQLRDITPLTNNTNAYNFGTLNYDDPIGQRWGDYCSLALDPINNLDIWATNQIVSGQNLWSVLATQLIPA